MRIVPPENGKMFWFLNLKKRLWDISHVLLGPAFRRSGDTCRSLLIWASAGVIYPLVVGNILSGHLKWNQLISPGCRINTLHARLSKFISRIFVFWPWCRRGCWTCCLITLELADYVLRAETEEAIRSVRLCHWFLIDLLDMRSHFHASSPPALHKTQHEMSPLNWDALFYLGWEIHLNLFNLSCLDMGIILVVFYGCPVHFTSCKSSL